MVYDFKALSSNHGFSSQTINLYTLKHICSIGFISLLQTTFSFILRSILNFECTLLPQGINVVVIPDHCNSNISTSPNFSQDQVGTNVFPILPCSSLKISEKRLLCKHLYKSWFNVLCSLFNKGWLCSINSWCLSLLYYCLCNNSWLPPCWLIALVGFGKLYS